MCVYICIHFFSIVWFLQFLSYFLFLLEGSSKFIPFYPKFGVKRARFLASKCTSLLLCSKPVQWNYQHFFKDFKPKSMLYRLKQK